MRGEERYELVAVKRAWCPERLYSIACLAFAGLMTKAPLRGIFHRELSGRERQGMRIIPELSHDSSEEHR
jgi:hypothetical protein